MKKSEAFFESMTSNTLANYTSDVLNLKMEEKLSSETLATTYETSRHQNPEKQTSSPP
jgi:hypothetical protein